MSDGQVAASTAPPQNVAATPATQMVPPVPPPIVTSAPAPKTETPTPASEIKLLCLSDKIEHNFVTGIIMSFPIEFFGPDWINEFEASSWKKVPNSENLEYLLRCFPAGDSDRNRGFISAQIELRKPAFSTKETYIVSLGIRVAEDDRTKTFTFVGEDPQCIYIPQFVSHDYIKDRKLVKDDYVKIQCSAICQPVRYCNESFPLKKGSAYQDYPTSELFEGPVNTTNHATEVDAASVT
uniref:Bestrophin homolog n=1 Tax=Panagrellus redivivus TaxID=6233 RepID=A0A7E4V029_PANRE